MYVVPAANQKLYRLWNGELETAKFIKELNGDTAYPTWEIKEGNRRIICSPEMYELSLKDVWKKYKSECENSLPYVKKQIKEAENMLEYCKSEVRRCVDILNILHSEDKRIRGKYYIVNTKDVDEDGKKLFWSNIHGWTDYKSANRWSEEQKNLSSLPVDGKWTTLTEVLDNGGKLSGIYPIQ